MSLTLNITAVLSEKSFKRRSGHLQLVVNIRGCRDLESQISLTGDDLFAGVCLSEYCSLFS